MPLIVVNPPASPVTKKARRSSELNQVSSRNIPIAIAPSRFTIQIEVNPDPGIVPTKYLSAVPISPPRNVRPITLELNFKT